ncbi:calmodulin-like protein containing EF hand domain [Diplonema papillatum]|nr:calmodulin-like protein containing EF hand domain [Diplonema papillatum]
MFFLSCGTDLYGRKQNVKLEFASCPTMTELINAVESQFDVMARASRPAGYPDVPFKVQTFQIYDDILLRWVDLYSSSQLANGCQVFCFQPESIWHSDSQGIIPEAKEEITWTTPVGSARRARIATDAGVAPPLSEKLRSVFYDIDIGNKGYILYADLRAAFAKADMEFTYSTVGELFTQADSNRSGHVTYDEWVRFAVKYPTVIDALFFRSRDISGGVGGSHVAYAYSMDADPSSVQRARETQLRQYYTDTWQGSAQRDRAMSDYEAAKRDADAARMQKEMAESKERQAWDRLYYNPTSPRFY